jgi:hypothetical protein
VEAVFSPELGVSAEEDANQLVYVLGLGIVSKNRFDLLTDVEPTALTGAHNVEAKPEASNLVEQRIG